MVKALRSGGRISRWPRVRTLRHSLAKRSHVCATTTRHSCGLVPEHSLLELNKLEDLSLSVVAKVAECSS